MIHETFAPDTHPVNFEMFNRNPWLNDPFQRLHFNQLPFQSYHNYSARNISPHKHRSRPNTRCHAARRASHLALDAIEGSEFSDESTAADDRYYLDDQSSQNARLNTKHSDDNDRPLSIKPALQSVRVKFPQRSIETLGLREDDVLILTPALKLWRLKVHIRSHHATETLCAAVAGDVRLRDVVKQLLPAAFSGEVRVHVKARGEWQEPGLAVKVGDIAAVGREVEVKIVVTSEGLERRGPALGSMGLGLGMRGARGWEVEMGVGRETVWMY
ncbi:Nn.00g068980.m01.CDS01 [Neocucurbitaria sp. VM-36]